MKKFYKANSSSLLKSTKSRGNQIRNHSNLDCENNQKFLVKTFPIAFIAEFSGLFLIAKVFLSSC